MEQIHKLSAAVVFAFLCLHFGNHFAGLFGEAAHSQYMDAVRILYRHPGVEWAVLVAFAVQIATGVPLVLEIWRKKKDFVHQLMALSGVSMVLFIVIHVASVLAVRYVFHLDTNFSYVASSLMTKPWSYGFFALYGLGVFSLFVHFACIAYDIFKKTNKPVAWLCLIMVTGIGAYVTWLLLAVYSGAFYPVRIPTDYTAIYHRWPF